MSDLLVTDHAQMEALEYNLCKEVAETLHAAYPGHLWTAAPQGGILIVRNAALSGSWGFVFHIPKIYSASEFKRRVIMAGGELLERYRMSRGAFNAAQYAGLKTDHAGHFIPEV